MNKEFNDDKQNETINDFNERVNSFKEEDLGSTTADGKFKFENLSKSIPKPLKDLWEDIKELISLMDDYTKKRYRDIPLKSILAIGASIAYFVSPIDIVPDALPIIGFLDDAFVIKFALDLIKEDIMSYRHWKENNS